MVIPAILMALQLVLDPLSTTGEKVDWSQSGGEILVGETAPSVEAAVELEAARPPAVVRAPVLPWSQAVEAAASRHGLDPKLLHALVLVESAYRPDAVSPAGAAGLTQLMPATAAELGVTDPFDIEQNLSGGADYLARQLLRFGDLKLALAAYNAGPSRVARLGRVPDIDETRNYVASVVDCYLMLTAGRGGRSARDCRAREPGL